MIRAHSKSLLQLCSLSGAKLCLATKNQSIEKIKLANISPSIILAENKVQEAEEKFLYYQSICNPLHLIGPLQKNKIRKAVRLFDVIQSVDSLDLLRKIDRISAEEEKPVEVFLNINISEDPKKTGFRLDEIITIFESLKQQPLQSIEITGLFTILQKDLRAKTITSFYSSLKKLFDMFQKFFGPRCINLSMGMSNDYMVALQSGSTLVRIGSAIFSEKKED